MIPTKVKSALRFFEFRIVFCILGLYDNSYPIFRYTGTAPDGDVSPVNWSRREINVDSVVNGGVFLCLRPGYYHFTAAMNAGGSRTFNRQGIDVWIDKNNAPTVSYVRTNVQ